MLNPGDPRRIHVFYASQQKIWVKKINEILPQHIPRDILLNLDSLAKGLNRKSHVTWWPIIESHIINLSQLSLDENLSSVTVTPAELSLELEQVRNN